MNYEIRHGTLARRLLRPIHPMLTFAVQNLAAQPLRLVVAIPMAVFWLGSTGAGQLPRDPVLWMAWGAAMVGSWLITYLSNIAIGSLAFFMESSVKIMEVWLTLFFVFSGYLIPVELFPRAVGILGDWLPFRYQIGLPVEMMTSAHDRSAALALLGRQWAWVAVLLVGTLWLWRRGLRRFAAYGG
jgi:ABC-2 type transport system permease protein